MSNPLEQFKICHYHHLFSVGNYDIVLSNMTGLLVLSFSLYAAFSFFALRNPSLIPGNIQAMFELSLSLPSRCLRSIVSEDDYNKNISWIVGIFYMVLITDLLGNIPMVLSTTSHICLNVTWASICMGIITIYGIKKHGIHFIRVFAPSSLPAWALPIMFPVEVCTYIAKIFSLAVRLTANMIGGHIVLDIVATIASRHFAIAIIGSPIVGALTGFEIMVSVLQAYIFAMLVSIYLSQVSSLDH